MRGHARRRRPGSRAGRPAWILPSSRARPWRISIPTIRSSTGSACGPPGAPTGIACAIACANCVLRRGPIRPATASRSGWPPLAPRWVASRNGRPEWNDRPPADLIVATGGAWAVAPAPAVALALVDVLRRPGAGQYALDHARILAPLGSIPDADERRAMIADLIDDILAPLGTIVTPAGLHPGRSAGSLVVHGSDGSTRLDLMPGGLALIDLPPGTSAVAEFKFRESVRLGARGKHFAIDVTGGLGGLVIDMRDVPLKLPDRSDIRGELLESWQTAIVTGREV